ncbi:MAG: DUF47 family protein [Desulfurococcaceae archaeon]
MEAVEEGVESAIAELNSIDYIIALARSLADSLTLFRELLKYAANDIQHVDKLYERLRDVKNKVEEERLNVMDYLVRVEVAMRNARGYINIVNDIERTAQLLDGAGYRLGMLAKQLGPLEGEVLKLVEGFVDTLQRQLDFIIDAVDKLRSNPRRSIVGSNEVDKLEESADAMYRQAMFELYRKYSNDIFKLMATKDLLEFLEDACDALKRVGEEIRFIALMRTAI